MAWPLVLLVAAPLVAGVASLLARDRRVVDALQCAQAGALPASAVLVAGRVVSGGGVSAGIFLQADALSAWLDLIIGVVGSTGTLYAVGYMGEEMDRGHLSARRYQRFFCLFDLYLAAMLVAVNQENIALMWIAVEGSTLSAALLIGFERSKVALEAGWKYVILSSVGIALALFGTILVYYSSEHLLGVSSEALRWLQLYRVAEGLDPTAIKVAFIFAVIGYGTKAGVAPMHTWLPDAHAEAPTPVSAMLSANMLTLAVYAILRFKAVTDRAVGPAFSGRLLVGLGLLSLTIAAAFFLVQRDYKRLFAYSSIEHIGIALLGFGVGGAGTFAGAWHLLNHALAKSTAFYGAGLVFLRHDHKLLDRVTGLLGQMPLAGGAMLVAGVALAGLPPFGLFASEVLIAAGAYMARPELAAAFLGLLALAFATLLYQVFRMTLGSPGDAGRAVGPRCRLFTGAAVGINAALLGTIGLHVPPGLETLLRAVVSILTVEAP
ncbi:MAG TPA: proton-conducting transporter membrane subunit [Nitrospiraceae bacterium]|jgi:hydrogenase-4 component F|nr:proton-conducting transporter membrane subunit [Nitrospiraceae bacterium]